MKTQNVSNNVITESTAIKSNPENKKNGNSPLWQSVLVGGVPGILIGAGGTVGAEAIANSATSEEQGKSILEEAGADFSAEIHEAHSVTDEMSFSEAFATARAEVGPGGAFSWRGHVYGTYRGDDPEWQEMSAEDRAAHSQQILSQVHASPYTPTENEPEIVPAPDYSGVANNEIVENSSDDSGDIEVHILGVGEIEAPDGPMAQVGVGTFDNHAAIFADTDGDDLVDTVLIDTNDNARVDQNEIYDATESGITVDDLRNAVEPGITGVIDENPDTTTDSSDGSLFI